MAAIAMLTVMSQRMKGDLLITGYAMISQDSLAMIKVFTHSELRPTEPYLGVRKPMR